MSSDNFLDDHWLGLEKVHLLTKNTTKERSLRVDLWDHEDGAAFAEYNNFKIGTKQAAFKLEVGKYSGDAGNSSFFTLLQLSIV